MLGELASQRRYEMFLEGSLNDVTLMREFYQTNPDDIQNVLKLLAVRNDRMDELVRILQPEHLRRLSQK